MHVVIILIKIASHVLFLYKQGIIGVRHLSNKPVEQASGPNKLQD